MVVPAQIELKPIISANFKSCDGQQVNLIIKGIDERMKQFALGVGREGREVKDIAETMHVLSFCQYLQSRLATSSDKINTIDTLFVQKKRTLELLFSKKEAGEIKNELENESPDPQYLSGEEPRLIDILTEFNTLVSIKAQIEKGSSNIDEIIEQLIKQAQETVDEIEIKIIHILQTRKVLSQSFSSSRFALEAVANKIDTEHVLYEGMIKIVPDTHGVEPDFYGVSENDENVISLGDIIDAPKNLDPRRLESFLVAREQIKKRMLDDAKNRPKSKLYNMSEEEIDKKLNKRQAELEREKAAFESVDIKESIEVWTNLLESGKGQIVLGNHELMAMSGIFGNDADLSQWLLDGNKGKTTLAALGLDITTIPRVVFNEDAGIMTPLPHDVCEKIRGEVMKIPIGKRFFETLRNKGKMYIIANELLCVHAGVSVSDSGDLIPPQRNGRAWPGFENLTGLDAFDLIEEKIRQGDTQVLHWLASGSSKEMAPAWMRDPFIKVMNNSQLSARVISQLDNQARERGGCIKGIVGGHTEAVSAFISEETLNLVGGLQFNGFFGADTGKADVITLTVSNGRDVLISTRHNFNQEGKIGYQMTREI